MIVSQYKCLFHLATIHFCCLSATEHYPPPAPPIQRWLVLSSISPPHLLLSTKKPCYSELWRYLLGYFPSRLQTQQAQGLNETLLWTLAPSTMNEQILVENKTICTQMCKKGRNVFWKKTKLLNRWRNSHIRLFLFRQWKKFLNSILIYLNEKFCSDLWQDF